MERDMELVRSILLRLEAVDGSNNVVFFKVDGYPSGTVAEHCDMMYQHGLIRTCRITRGFEGCPVFWEVGGITWKGYDYLDTIRDNSIWRKTKAAIAKKGLPLMLETVKTVASAFVSAAAEGVAKSIIKNGGVD